MSSAEITSYKPTYRDKSGEWPNLVWRCELWPGSHDLLSGAVTTTSSKLSALAAHSIACTRSGNEKTLGLIGLISSWPERTSANSRGYAFYGYMKFPMISKLLNIICMWLTGMGAMLL